MYEKVARFSNLFFHFWLMLVSN